MKHLELLRTMLLKVAICSEIRNLYWDVNQHPHFENFLLGKKKRMVGYKADLHSSIDSSCLSSMLTVTNSSHTTPFVSLA